jgi:hypothetical protein
VDHKGDRYVAEAKIKFEKHPSKIDSGSSEWNGIKNNDHFTVKPEKRTDADGNVTEILSVHWPEGVSLDHAPPTIAIEDILVLTKRILWIPTLSTVQDICKSRRGGGLWTG